MSTKRSELSMWTAAPGGILRKVMGHEPSQPPIGTESKPNPKTATA
jgi:hypothetical protein